MAITFEQKRKKQQLFMALFFVIILIIAALLYFSFFEPPWAPSLPTSPVSPGVELPPGITVTQITFDKTIIDELKPPNFKSHGILPIEIGDLGRENPFIPY